MNLQIVKWSPGQRVHAVERFLCRPAFDAEAESVASGVLEDIRSRGEAAVLEAVARYDGVVLKASQLEVDVRTLKGAVRQVAPPMRRAVREAHRRVREFSRAGLRRDWRLSTPGGGNVGERFMPLERVGVYVPGGSAPLVSTVVMTVTLARVAGVREVVVCTPPGRDGGIEPVLLHAMQVAGATEVYRVGGIQAIGMMAYGTRRVRPVQKIVGPGNAYVTAAKRQVYGRVALDLVAGPSEIAVLADERAPASWVAADLLSQIEHGTGHEKALLATSSLALARRVSEQLVLQARKLSRHAFLQQVLAKNVLLVKVAKLADGMALCNRFAPEHLELLVAQPARWLKQVRAAGAVFLGPWSPEAAGDFVAGPSHVLPTGGAARMFSGLTVEDFRRRFSVIQFTRSDLSAALPVIEAFGAVEGLDGHARSAVIRFEDHEKNR